MKKLICKLPKWLGGGHLRGKRTDTRPSDDVIKYQCPRCHATWTRKVKDKK